MRKRAKYPWQASGSLEGPQWAQIPWLADTNCMYGGICGICQGCKWHQWKKRAKGATLHRCQHPGHKFWDGSTWQATSVLIPASCPYQVSRAWDYGKGPQPGDQLALLILL